MPSEFRYLRRVEFADTDTAGLIHFTSVMRFMEEAEHALYRSLGVGGYQWSEDAVFGMPRVAVSCQYLAPIRYGDEVEIRLVVREVRTKAIRYGAEFTVERDTGRTLAAVGDMTVVCTSRRHGERGWRSVEIPPELKRQLEPAG